MLLRDFNAKIKRTRYGLTGDDDAGLYLIDTAVINNLEILNFNPITNHIHITRGNRREKEPTNRNQC